MRVTRTSATATAALLGASLLLAACSDTTDDESTDAVTSAETEPGTESAGGASGTITVYTSEPQAKIDEIVAAYNEQYPDVTVEIFRAGTGELTARLATEQEAGEIQADILLAADAPTFEQYKADGELAEYTPEDVESLNDDVVDPDGYYVGTRLIPTVIAYNTGAVEEPPTSWASLTDEQWSGQIAMPNPQVSGAAAYNATVWLLTDDLGEEWLADLGANDVTVLESNGPVSQAVAGGTQSVGVVVDYLVRELAEQGSPIELVYPEDGVPYVSQPAAIMADSDNPEAAGTFIDFLVSAEGQELAVEQSYLPVRGDVGTPEGAPELADLTLLTPDLDTLAERQDEAVTLFGDLVG